MKIKMSINESFSDIPDNILDHWLYHYDLWCKENNQEPEYNDVEEIKANEEALKEWKETNEED